MTVREKLDELEFHLMTLQEDETIRRCRKLVREVIEEKFGGKCESDSDDSGDDAWRSA